MILRNFASLALGIACIICIILQTCASMDLIPQSACFLIRVPTTCPQHKIFHKKFPYHTYLKIVSALWESF